MQFHPCYFSHPYDLAAKETDKAKRVAIFLCPEGATPQSPGLLQPWEGVERSINPERVASTRTQVGKKFDQEINKKYSGGLGRVVLAPPFLQEGRISRRVSLIDGDKQELQNEGSSE